MFNAYNPYAFNNSTMGGYPQRQTSMATSQPYLKGRVVTSVDEVRAAQIDLDGSVTYFASPMEGKIYAKGIDMQGLPYIQVYELQKAPVCGTMGIPQELEARIVALENKIKEMTSNVQLTPNDANAQ